MKLPLLFGTLLLLGTSGASVVGCASQPASTGADPQATESPAPASPLNAKIGAATHAEAAAASLKTLTHLITPQNVFGFHSVSEATSASLAAPLPMFMVGLDALRAYRAGNDPRSLLREEGSVIYPLTVDGEVRSSVLVHKVAGTDGEATWKATQFGRPALAKLANEGRASLARARRVDESGFSLVEIPAMSIRMLAHEEHGVPMLTALADVPGTSVHAGATLAAADAFALLQPVAVETRELAPN